MRDFPVFTTEYGVSSLFLKEIPYKQEAYIRILDVQEDGFREHLRECAAFCRMAGAERIFCADDARLEVWPYAFSMLEMRGTARPEEAQVESLFPVTEATVGRWRQICNEKMRPIACTATQTARDEEEILKGGACFVHRDGELLGIGWLRDGEIRTVAAVQPGMGRRVMHTLMSMAEGEDLHLEVVSTNERAIRLYQHLGFVAVREKSRWYDVSGAWADCEKTTKTG